MRTMRILKSGSRPSLYFSMTGISTLSSRRFPASLSRRPITVVDAGRWTVDGGLLSVPSTVHRPPSTNSSVVAGHRLDGEDDLFVRHVVAGAREAGVAAVHQDGAVAFGVAPQGTNELPALRVVQRAEVHGSAPSFG